MSQDGTTPNREAIFNAGAASIFGKQGVTLAGDKLEVKRYPENVGQNEVPHYVMFFITKRSSDIGTGEAFDTSVSIDISNANRPVLKNFSEAAFQAAVGTGVARASSNAIKSVSNLSFGAGSFLGGAAQAVGTVLSFGAGVKAAKSASANNPSKVEQTQASQSDSVRNGRDRVVLKKCIALYIPGTPSSTYKAIWQDRDIGILGGAEQYLSNIDTSGDNILNTAKSIVGNLAPAAVAIGLANTPKLEGIGDLGGLVTSSQGIAINPFRTQLFQNMGFRTFSFDYNFQPKNDKEYLEVKEIIKTFKKYMHPTLKDDRIIMGYPGEFTIAYYYKDGVNDNLFKVGNCVLTDMKISYGGTDFITFKDSGGAPSEINMTLQFTELEILTDQRIEEGY